MPLSEPLLSRTGPGTPMGALMRRYWIPAFFSADLPPNQALRGKLLGENLVAYRDAAGRVGLLQEKCAHRRGSLFFGRKEGDGIRCVFHGWKFDLRGRCIDRPAAGEDEAATLTAYPCMERGGLIWTYMGDSGAVPRASRLEWILVPDAHRVASRELRNVNWLQALEQDPGTPGAPPILLPPFHTIVSSGHMPDAASRANVWVPVDDRHCMVYTVHYSTTRPVLDAEVGRPEVSRSHITLPEPSAGAATGRRADVRDYLLSLLEHEREPVEPSAEEADESSPLELLALSPFASPSAAPG